MNPKKATRHDIRTFKKQQRIKLQKSSNEKNVIANLRIRLLEAEEALDAIKQGQIDALIVGSNSEKQIYTLRSADEPYRILVEAMNEGAVTLLEDTSIVYCNSAFSQIIGIPQEIVRNYQLLSLISESSRSEFEAIYRNAKTSHARGEVTLIKHSESKKTQNVRVFLSFSKIKLEDQTEAYSIVVTDLTEQKQREKILESERLARAILDQTGEAIVVCDDSGKVIRANQRAHLLCEMNPLYSSFDDVFQIYLADGKRLGAPHGEISEKLSIIRGLEGYLIRKDHSLVYLQLSIGPVQSGNKILGTVVTLTDITERKRIERELKEAIGSRDEFLSIASHELKTPLTSMKLQVQMRQRYVNRGDTSAFRSEKIIKMLQDDNRQVNRLIHLIDDMLDISRISTGKLSLHLEQFDLCTLVQEVIDRFTLQLTASGCEVNYKTCGSVVGNWDRYRIEQVIVNLLTNAMKYGEQKPIGILIQKSDNSVQIQVRDQGRGIAETDQTRIFKRFERAISVNEISGLGLGFYIVGQILELHGGSIHVKSKLGEGSTFIVQLPYLSSQSVEAVS